VKEIEKHTFTNIVKNIYTLMILFSPARKKKCLVYIQTTKLFPVRYNVKPPFSNPVQIDRVKDMPFN
jgi:hypothetical protein